MLVFVAQSAALPLCSAFCSIICFATYDDMRNVIRKLDGTELNGKRIRFVEVC